MKSKVLMGGFGFETGAELTEERSGLRAEVNLVSNSTARSSEENVSRIKLSSVSTSPDFANHTTLNCPSCEVALYFRLAALSFSAT